MLQRELAALEARQAQLAAQAAAPAPAPVAIHPNASEIYRKKVSELHDALTAEDTRAGAAEALRGLIDEIRVMPEDEGHAVEIVGELGALLQLASGNKNAASIHEAARSIKLVAGTCNQLYLKDLKITINSPKRWRSRPGPRAFPYVPGETGRAIVRILREAVAPMSTREIAMALPGAQREDQSDWRVLKLMYMRVGVTLLRCRNKGLVRSRRGTGKYLLWEIVG